jgi:hypothetical protein
VRRAIRWPLVLLLPVTLLSAGIWVGLFTDTGYDVTCCTQADIDQLWQPGTTMELHWTVVSDSSYNLPDRVFDRFENPTHKVFVTAFLSGPYSDPAAIKQIMLTGGASAGGISDVRGSVTALDDRTRPSTAPVTTFVLPTDLTPGYYDLSLMWQDGNGGTVDPRNIVRVGMQ